MLINDLVYSSLFSSDKEKTKARTEIRKLAKKQGIFLASTHNLYQAIGHGKISGFTVPAFNIRFLTYDTAKIIFRLAKKMAVGIFIFEIARSEQKYTDQTPDEYVTTVLAAAIAENYQGSVFVQGDHYQFSASKYHSDPKAEINSIKNLINESIAAGFYNIDVDASTLVDLTRKDIDNQQRDNYMMTALMTKYIREIQPPGVTVSIGGEIGHIGEKNSTVGDFKAFMKGFIKEIQMSKSKFQIKSKVESSKKETVGLSKISVQTGTSHGGLVLPDGKIADISLDFNVLKKIGEEARHKYHLGGAVQHGASTLPAELFDKFPKVKTLEIHLATGFQNIVYQYLPEKIQNDIYSWLEKNCKNEWKENVSGQQFVYRTRKKAAGPFKKKLWALTDAEKKPILINLEKRFEFLFEKLKVVNTKKILEKY